MQEYLIRHLTGSRAPHVDRVSAGPDREITFGRDPSANIHFDSSREDSVVSRWHAKAVADPAAPGQLQLLDLGSANGILVNHEPVVGRHRLRPGDLVQLGPGGPTFRLEPAGSALSSARPTRLVPADAGPGERAVVHAAQQIKREVRKMFFVSSIVLAAIALAPFAGQLSRQTYQVAAVARPVVRQQAAPAMAQALPPVRDPVAAAPVFTPPARPVVRGTPRRALPVRPAAAPRPAPVPVTPVTPVLLAEAEPAPSVATAAPVARAVEAVPPVEKAPPPAKSTAQIASENMSAIIELGVSWRLEDVATGRVVHQVHLMVEPNRRARQLCSGRVALFMQTPNGIEPVLVLDDRDEYHRPVGGQHTGTGFFVTPDGYVVSNIHVATPWEAPYEWDDTPACLADFVTGSLTPLNRTLLPAHWIPSKARVFAGTIRFQRKRGADAFLVTPGGGEVRGNIAVEAMFAKTKDRYPAQLVRAHDMHDVSLLKVSVPFAVRPVSLNDNYAGLQEGDRVVVAGYPRGSSYDPVLTRGLRPAKLGLMAVPTVDQGVVGRFVTDGPALLRDLVQIQVPSLGTGVSGAPVFDEQGRAVAIANSSLERGRATGAVPIRHALELLSTRRIAR